MKMTIAARSIERARASRACASSAMTVSRGENNRHEILRLRRAHAHTAFGSPPRFFGRNLRDCRTPLDTAQHPDRVLDPSLGEPELGECPGRESVRCRKHAPGHLDRIGEKCLGGAPVTVLEQNPAVVGAALRIQERTPVPVDEALERLNPLRRALQIETAAAHDHRHAAHLGDRQRITALTADHAGHRLIKQRHAFPGPALLYQGLTDGVHCHQLQAGVSVRAPDLGRLARQCLAPDRIVGDVGGGPQEFPAQLRNLVLDDPCRTRQPSAGRSRVAQIPLVVAHQRQSGAGREHQVAAAAESGIGLLAIGNRARDITEPEQRVRQARQRLGHLGHFKDGRKSITCAAPVAGRHGLEPGPYPTLSDAWLSIPTAAHTSIVSDPLNAPCLLPGR